MNRKILVLIFLVTVLFQCGTSQKEVVIWNPEQPRGGERIAIRYYSHSEMAALSNVENIITICEIYSDQDDTVLTLPMIKKKNYWETDLQLPSSSYLISIKFEDELNRVDDNNGRGWSIKVRDENNNVHQNTHYKLGQIYRGRNRPEALPYYKKAIEEFRKELKLFPENYKTWLELWDAQMVLNEKNSPIINRQLDSLENNNESSYELCKLAMFTHWQLLKNREKALEYADHLKKTYSHLESFDEVAYPMIYLQNEHNSQEQIIALEKFIVDNPGSDYMQAAYFRLGNYYLQQRENLKAKYLFQKLSVIVPDNVANKLSLASMEINNKNYDVARKLLTSAHEYCTEAQMLLNNPWMHPGKRKNQLNIDLCQIYSLTANLNSAIGDHLASIESRIAAIDLGTPFPAFEWEHIGKSYLQLNDKASAKSAFIKALSINPAQKKIKELLRAIFISEKRLDAGFEEFLENAIKEELKASAYPAPDFIANSIEEETVKLSDMQNIALPYQIILNRIEEETVKLSDMQGKVIVINFWNSWSNACVREIPSLNQLVDDLEEINIVEFWAISDENKTVIQNFLEAYKFKYKHFYNGSKIRKQYKIIGFPTHIVIDPSGLIRYKYVGFTPDIKYRLKENIQLILQETKIIS